MQIEGRGTGSENDIKEKNIGTKRKVIFEKGNMGRIERNGMRL